MADDSDWILFQGMFIPEAVEDGTVTLKWLEDDAAALFKVYEGSGPGASGIELPKEYQVDEWRDQTFVLEACAQGTYHLVAEYASPQGVKSRDVVKIVVMRMDLTGWRPQNIPIRLRFPMRGSAVPEQEEDRDTVGDDVMDEGSPGVGIRGVEELYLYYPYLRDNMIRVELDLSPVEPGDGGYYLVRNRDVLRVWKHPVTGWNDQLLGLTLDEVKVVPSQPKHVLWVEWIGPSDGEAYLDLEYRSSSGYVVRGDRLRFYPFQSTVIGWPGERFLVNWTRPYDGHGIYQIGMKLYRRGYDVHIFEEDSGWRTPLEYLLRRRFREGGAKYLAMYGHSHGGGNVYDLSVHKATDFELGGIPLSFTAYVDAVRQPGPFVERRRPVNAEWLANYYQTNSWPRGGPLPEGQFDFQINVNETTWGVNIKHKTIHTHPNVQSGIIQGIVPERPDTEGLVERLER